MLQSGIIVVEKPPSIANQQQKQKPNHEIQYVEYYEPTEPPLQHHHAIVLDNNFALPQSTQNNHQRITQMLQLSEQPNAATTSNIIVPTADFASNQIFKIVSTTDGTGGIESRQMFIDATTNPKMLLGNITMLPKQVGNATNANNISVLPTTQTNQQPQTINFVGTKNIPYISGGSATQLNGKKFPTKNANVKNQIQTTGTFVQQTPQHVVHKVNVPTKVISRMPTIVQQASNNTNHNITQQQSTNHPYVVSQSHKYVTTNSSNIPKIGNIIKKNVNKSCQNKITANNTQQQGTVKTFIAQQAYQYHPNNNNKITKTKLLKQLGNSTGGGVSIATLPLQQSFGTYTINSNKLSSNNQNNATTKVTKMTNNKFIMQNQQQHVATLPQGTQLQHKTMQATQPQSNIVVQQQILPNSIVGGNGGNSSASNSNIKYVNSQGAVIQQHQTHPSSQHSQKYRQQFLDAPVCIQRENNTVTNNTASAISNYQTELDMTDEMSARILQSMAQKHFNKQQAQQHHQQKLKVLPSQSQPHYIIQNSPGSTNIVLSPNDFSTYNSQQQNSFMPISAKTLITNVASSSAPSITLSNANAEKNHSTSVNRSQSLERKQLDANSAKRATEFIKNSNTSLPACRNNSNFNGLNVGALPTTESVAFIQSIKQNTDTTLMPTNSYSANAAANLSQDDDIIGEEVRPLPITDDVKLHCLHAVWLDHTYANAAPTRLTTEVVSNNASSSSLHKTVSSSGHVETQPSSTLVSNTVPNNWALGGIGAASVTNAPSDITLITVPSSIASTSSGTPSVYSLYGQQIPRQPQDDDAHSAISNGSRVATGDIDPGEETETAPEAEAEDDSLTRCICDLTHDDGYMICCDKCSAWQHVDCMGIERHNIPEEYLCEICQPRPVDKVRARQIQLMIRKEQALSMQSGVSTLVDAAGILAASKMHFNENINRPGANISQKDTLQNAKNGGVLKKGKVLKKTKETGVKKLKRDKNGGVFSSGKNIRKETKKNTKRKSKIAESSSHPEKQSNHMRNLVEHYEHAMTNHYSQQLRARIYSLTKVPSIMQAINMKSNELLKEYRNFESKATIVPFAGGKILISNQDIKSNSPIVELLGKCMLQEQFISQNSHAYINDPPVTTNPLNKVHKTPGPFVFFYHLPNVEDHIIEGSTLTQLQGQKICIDCRTYGNEARFVRRSCRPNAKVQHIVEKNAVHLFIIATTDIRASTEITITHEPHDLLALDTPKPSSISVISTSTPCACTCVVCPFVNTTSKTSRRNQGSSVNNSPVSTVGVVSTNTTLGNPKKKQLSNRNRSTSSSTSSSGDSTIGLNSPNFINNLYKSNTIGNNPRTNSNSKNVFPIVGTTKSSNGNLLSVRSNLNDPSPFITISPIQQQQQKLPVLQNSLMEPALTEPTLVIQANHQNTSSLPSSMIVSPHQLQLPQQPQAMPVIQQISLAVAAAPDCMTASAVSTNNCIVAQSNFEEEKVEKSMISQLQTPVSPILLQTSSKHQDSVVELPLLPQQQPVQVVVNSKDATIDDTLAASALQTLNSANKPSTEIEQNIINPVTPLEKDEVDNPKPQQHVSQSIHNNTTAPNVPVQETSSHKQLPANSTSTDTGRKINTRNTRLTSCSDDVSNDCQLGTEEGSNNTNTVVTSTPNVGQKLSREDRKMQAIIRAFENLERKQKKQSKSTASKRRSSNNNNGNSSSEIELLNSKKSSLTTRKKKRKPYKSHQVNGAQRKRRKSRINSNESDADHDADAENDTIPMSECESTSMLSPPIQTTAANTASDSINTPALVTSALVTTDAFINESTNVDQAAGLLMAFANPNKITNLDSLNYPLENHLPETQKVFPNINVSNERYLINNEFKSPQRLSLPVENVMSPPSTPPTQISSACLLIEAAVGPLENLDNGSSPQCDDGFKYPGASRTKKAITDWTHQDAQSTSHNCNLTNVSGITMSSTTAGVLGLDSLVQAAMSDFSPQQNFSDKISDESQNVSIAAKKIEEFINQTEGSSSPLINLEEQYTGLNTHSVSNKQYNALTELNVESAERHLQLPLQVSTCNNSSVKKRWLRQAISEETDESALTPSPVTPSTTSPTSQISAAFPVNNGFSTPLKKRRLVLRNKDDELNESLSLNQTSQIEAATEEGATDLNKSEMYVGSSSPLRTEEVDVVGSLKTEDEAEIVDVGTDIILPVKHDLKQENEDIKPSIELSIENEKKSEIVLDQDDDVDILRSPSPGQKMVAEDNLVKIEPEDMNCCDEVKIDVEREESMTGDKFKDFVDIKTEENKQETVKIKDDVNLIDTTLENNDIKKEIYEINSVDVPKTDKEKQLLLFMDDQKTVLQKGGSVIKKIEQQISLEKQIINQNLTENMPASNDTKNDSVTYTSISKRERKDLSDDDIKERLHSFHKENILFLQSRNKKSKSESSSSVSTETKSKYEKRRNEKSTFAETSGTKKSHHSSASKKSHKKERSRSCSGTSTSKTNVHNVRGEHSNNTHTPTSTKPDTATTDIVVGVNSSSSSNKKVKSLANTANTTTSIEKERNRHRSLSSSLSGNFNTKKRQLNFDQELNKDIVTICTKIRKDKDESSSSNAKKRRMSNSLLNEREDNRNSINNSNNKIIKSQSASSVISSNTKILDKIYEASIKDKTPATTSVSNINLPTSTVTSTNVVTTSISYTKQPTQQQYRPLTQQTLDEGYQASAPIVNEHISLPTFNNIVLTGTNFNNYVSTTSTTLPSTPTIPPNNTMPLLQVSTNVTTLPIIESSTTAGVNETQQLNSKSNISTFASSNHNSIYGKLQDNLNQQHSILASTQTTPSSNTLLSLSTTITPDNHITLSDTNVRSFSTLGNYQQHSTLCTLDTGKYSSDVINSITISTEKTTNTTINANSSNKFSTPLKQVSKDPRLNPTLNTPDPPPAPKRKLSILEYRKRMKLSTSESSTSGSMPSTPITPETPTGTNLTNSLLTTGSNFKTSTDTELNTSVERVDLDITTNMQKSSNINSKDDVLRGQFSAEPTLLEKQQEKYLEARQFNETEISLLDKTKLHFSLSNSSNLDNCLDPISSSSSSNSVSSSRESSP